MYTPILDFLGPQLEQYKDTFIENGIEDLETVVELQDKDLKEMNIPLGHKLKILKKIREHPLTAEK